VIFERLEVSHAGCHDFIVSCSYLKIYDEDLCDLLVDLTNLSLAEVSNMKRIKKLEIVGDKNGTFCQGLSKCTVESADDVLELMRRAQQQRRIGETKMNKQNSRSHCIFTIKVTIKIHLKNLAEAVPIPRAGCLSSRASCTSQSGQ